MDMILYSTHCPKCNVLEKKLKERGYEFTICDDFEPSLITEDFRFDSVPVLQIGKTLYDFGTAITWLNEQEQVQEGTD